MYRILNKLDHESLVEVVDYRQKRGTVEKTYSIKEDLFDGDPQEITYSDLSDYFMIYCMRFGSLFRQYAIDNPGIVGRKEMMGYWTAPIYATDREVEHLMEEYGRLISNFQSKDVDGERKLHSIGLILSPPGSGSVQDGVEKNVGGP